MAKLRKQEYESRSLQSLNSPVVLVIDLINGFIHEGALADPDIDAAAAGTEKLLRAPTLAEAPSGLCVIPMNRMLESLLLFRCTA